METFLIIAGAVILTIFVVVFGYALYIMHKIFNWF